MTKPPNSTDPNQICLPCLISKQTIQVGRATCARGRHRARHTLLHISTESVEFVHRPGLGYGGPPPTATTAICRIGKTTWATVSRTRLVGSGPTSREVPASRAPAGSSPARISYTATPTTSTVAPPQHASATLPHQQILQLLLPSIHQKVHFKEKGFYRAQNLPKPGPWDSPGA